MNLIQQFIPNLVIKSMTSQHIDLIRTKQNQALFSKAESRGVLCFIPAISKTLSNTLTGKISILVRPDGNLIIL